MAVPLYSAEGHSTEYMWCQGHADRVSVAVSVSAGRTASDQVLTRVFLQVNTALGRMDVGAGGYAKADAAVGRAGVCRVEGGPAGGQSVQDGVQHRLLRHLCLPRYSHCLMQVLFPRHLKRGDECFAAVLSFRDTLRQHIKGTKALLHHRMRAKTAEFLQRLDLSRRVFVGQEESLRKLASGKSFVRNAQ